MQVRFMNEVTGLLSLIAQTGMLGPQMQYNTKDFDNIK